MYGQRDVSSFLIQQGGKERLMKIQQHDGVVVDAAGIPAGLCQALLEEEEVSREGEGGTRGCGVAALPSPHYI